MKMKTLVNHPILFVIFRLFIGFIFIYAGTEKILNPADFAQTVDNYKIVPFPLVNFFAILLPWVEVLAGIFLILGLFIRGSSLIFLVLLFIFSLAISVNIIRGVDISCGCHTPWDATDKIGIKKLIEEVVFFLMTLQIFLHSSTTLCLDSLFRKPKQTDYIP